jgi:hypothetical protein
MHLEGDGGRLLDLSIVGYQFPSKSSGTLGFDHDANWLVVNGRVSDGTRSWSFQDPCLLTTEARELVAWLEAVADGWLELDTIDFTEPNLEFARVSAPADPPVIHVTFRLEAWPPWWNHVTEDDWDGVWLEFDSSREALAAAANDLKNEVHRYPER